MPIAPRTLGFLALFSILAIAATAQVSSTQKNIRVNDPAQDSLIEDHTTQSEVSLAVFGQTVVVVYVDTGQFVPRVNGRSSLTGFSVSTDGGKTFQDKGRLTGNAIGWGLSDPVITVDRRGNFYAMSNQRNAQGEPLMGVSKSSDEGQTFSVPVLIPGTGPSNSFYQDKPWITVDDTGGPFDGNLYIAWTEFTPMGEERVLFSRSIDGGQTFSIPTIASITGPVSQIGTSLAVGPGGELYLAWGEEVPDTERIAIHLRKSSDAGQSWSLIVTVGEALLSRHEDNVCPRSAGYILNGKISNFILPAIAVDRSSGPNRGRIYVVYETALPNNEDQSDIYFAALDSDLRTLIAPKRVNDDATKNEQFFPAIAVSPDGALGIAFFDRRLDPNNLLIDYFLAISKDGGATFGSNQRVTDTSFGVPPIAKQLTETKNFDSLRNECYMGDYAGIAADANNFYLAWGDNRNTVITPAYPSGRPDPDVYFAIVPIEK